MKKILFIGILIIATALIAISLYTKKLARNDIKEMRCEIINGDDNSKRIKLSARGGDFTKYLIKTGFLYDSVIIDRDNKFKFMWTYINGYNSDHFYKILKSFDDGDVNIESYYKFEEDNTHKYLQVRADILGIPFVITSKKLSFQDNCRTVN